MPKENPFRNVEDRRAADPIASLFVRRYTSPAEVPLADFYDRWLPQATPEAAGSELSNQLGYSDVGKGQLMNPGYKNAVYPSLDMSTEFYDALNKHSPEIQEKINAFLQRKNTP